MNKQDYLERLGRELTNRQIDRRRFMQGALAAGMTVTAATALADKAEAATPKKGGHMAMAVGHGSTSDSKDPGHFENDFQNSLTHGINGYLTEVAADGSLNASIAESWEGSADASEWVFKIRKGVEFQNGKTVTAEDVVASLNHHRGEDNTSAAAPFVKPITELKADGDDTVMVKLDAGNADFPFVMHEFHMPIMQAKSDGKMDWESMIGCGAYKIESYEPGVSAELSKYANYWDDSVGHFDTVQMLSIKDPNARTTALVAGDVDAMDRVELKVAGLLASKPGINVHKVNGNQHFTFPMDCKRAPYSDNNVRLALKYAIDREELVEKILFGFGAVGNDHCIGSGQRFFNSELAQRKYDPDKAKYHLKQAGLSDLKVSLFVSDAAFAGAIDTAVLMQNSASKCGIEITVERRPSDGFWADVWMKEGWVASYWSGRPVEDMMFSIAYQSGVPWNEAYWSNERFDQLLLAARAEIDQNKRRDMYWEMQQILSDDGGSVIPMYASFVFATNDSVGHPDAFATNWDKDGHRWMERWWKV